MSSKPTRTAATAGLRRAFRAFRIELETISKWLFAVARCLSENNCIELLVLFEASLLLAGNKKEHLTVSLEEAVVRNLAGIFEGWRGGDEGRIGYGCNRGGVHLMVFVWSRKGVVAMDFGGDRKQNLG